MSDAVADTVDERLRAALADRDPSALAQALRTSEFLLALAVGERGVAPLVATATTGARSLVVFSGRDAARAFGGVDRIGRVSGAELVRTAQAQQVHSVLLDPAGPAPAEFEAAQLQSLGDGLATGADGSPRLLGPLQARAVRSPGPELEQVVAQVRSLRTEAWVFERPGLAGPLLTVGVPGPPDRAAALAARLTEHRLVADVVPVPEAVVAELRRQVPDALVR